MFVLKSLSICWSRENNGRNQALSSLSFPSSRLPISIGHTLPLLGLWSTISLVLVSLRKPRVNQEPEKVGHLLVWLPKAIVQECQTFDSSLVVSKTYELNCNLALVEVAALKFGDELINRSLCTASAFSGCF